MSSKETQQVHAYARIRPFNKQEIECNAKKCLEVNGKDVILQVHHGSKRYCFDKVFGMGSKQNDLYTTVVEPMIQEVMQGYNCTVFTYGQTGTGKTYTMIGTPDARHDNPDAGIIPRTLGHLFENLNKNTDLDFTVRVSFLELYNEVLIDLLSQHDKVLKIYEDQNSKGSIQVHGLEQITIFNKEQVYDILQMGNERRVTASTNMNAHSSRSHTVFTVTIHSREVTPEGEELVKTGKLNLVDLAGSESILRSGAIDKRAKEAGNINQSLLTLGRVIKALVEKSGHIPYRESKLTRILQDSLGGKTKTTIIATVSPASNNIEETMSTLDYAFRARHITNRPEVNQRMCKKALIARYLEEIDSLKRDLSSARNKDGIFINPENYNKMLTDSEKQKDALVKSLEEYLLLEGRAKELERLREELQEVYKITKMDLSQATDSLIKSNKNLKKLMKQRYLHRELIDRYDEAQANLRQENISLVETVDTFVRDHNTLHTKVGILYDALQQNNKSSTELSNVLSKQFFMLSGQSDDIAVDITDRSKQFEMLSTDFSDDCRKILKDITDENINLKMSVINVIETNKDVMNAQLDLSLKFLLDRKEVSQNAARIIKEIFTKINQANDEQFGTIKTILKSQNDKNDTNKKKFDSLIEQFKSDLQVKLNEEVRFKNEAVLSKAEIQRKDLEKQIDELSECLDQAKLTIAAIKPNLQNFNNIYKNGIEETCQKCTAINTHVNNQCEHIASLLNEEKSIQKATNANILTTIKEIQSISKNQEDSLNKHIATMQDSDLHTIHEQQLNKNRKEILTKQDILQEDFNNRITQNENKLDMILNILIDNNDKVSEHVKNTKSSAEKNILSHKNCLQKLQEIVKTSLESTVVIKPQGSTPNFKQPIKYALPKEVDKSILQKVLFSTNLNESCDILSDVSFISLNDIESDTSLSDHNINIDENHEINQTKVDGNNT